MRHVFRSVCLVSLGNHAATLIENPPQRQAVGKELTGSRRIRWEQIGRNDDVAGFGKLCGTATPSGICPQQQHLARSRRWPRTG